MPMQTVGHFVVAVGFSAPMTRKIFEICRIRANNVPTRNC